MTMHINYKFDEFYDELKGFEKDLIIETTGKILEYFPELTNTKALMYFHPLIENAVATFVPLKYPKSAVNTEFPELAAMLKEFSNLDFAFRFSKVVTEGDEITRIINISHEFQHAVQFQTGKKAYFYGCIIRYCLDESVIYEEMVPTEYDAERKSKIVAYALCRKKEVDKFIQGMLADPNVPKTFWGIYNSIDVEKDYDFEDEVLKLWKIHNIEEKVDEFRKKSIRNVDQEKVIEMYDEANA